MVGLIFLSVFSSIVAVSLGNFALSKITMPQTAAFSVLTSLPISVPAKNLDINRTMIDKIIILSLYIAAATDRKSGSNT